MGEGVVMVTWDEKQVADYERKMAANRDKGLPPSPIVKHVIPVEPLGKKEGKATDPDRFRICITSVRKRQIDPDNLCGKFFTDALRYSGIIPEDTAEVIEYSIRQRKVATDEEPHTLITIERIK